MKIVCISDTHTFHDQVVVPEGDVLVHAGDATFRGKPREVLPFLDWLGAQPCARKVLIAGNHDWGYQLDDRAMYVARCAELGIDYLQDSEVVIDGVKFYGSPWQPWFCDWAFNLPRGKALASVWDRIPEDVNVLVTHGPPFGILDETGIAYQAAGARPNQGCEDLRTRLEHLHSLRLHVFGHIHESYGCENVTWHDPKQSVTFVNAASCNRAYRPVNPPIVVEI